MATNADSANVIESSGTKMRTTEENIGTNNEMMASANGFITAKQFKKTTIQPQSKQNYATQVKPEVERLERCTIDDDDDDDEDHRMINDSSRREATKDKQLHEEVNIDSEANYQNKKEEDDYDEADDNAIDLELIKEVRFLLKDALEARKNELELGRIATNGINGRATESHYDDTDHDQNRQDHNNTYKYSVWHYNELMDPNNPFTCWRYLLHTHKQLDDCVRLMLATLEWRHQYSIDPCMNNSQMIKEFWHMTPVVCCGKDKTGNSVYCIVGRHYRKPDPMLKDIIRQFILNLLFEWDRYHSRDLQKCTIIFDVSQTGYQNIDLDFMSWMVSIRDFLPARIANIYVIGIPFLIRPIVRLIISWLPENFRKILQCGTWQELVLANIEPSELPEELGGTRPDERIAPPNAPWWRDSPLFEKDKVDAIEWCIGFSCDAATREKRLKMQIEFEAKRDMNKNKPEEDDKWTTTTKKKVISN